MLPPTPSCIFLLVIWLCFDLLFKVLKVKPCNIKRVGDGLRHGSSETAAQELCSQHQGHLVPVKGAASPLEVLQQLGLEQLKEVEGEASIWDDPKEGRCQSSVKSQSSLCPQDASACVDDPVVPDDDDDDHDDDGDDDPVVPGLPSHLEGQPGPDGVKGEGGGDSSEPGKAAGNELHRVSIFAQPAKTKGGKKAFE